MVIVGAVARLSAHMVFHALQGMEAALPAVTVPMLGLATWLPLVSVGVVALGGGVMAWRGAARLGPWVIAAT